MKYSIVLDIGATKILGGVMINNKIIKKLRRPTGARLGRAKIMANIEKVIKGLMKERKMVGDKLEKIGLGLAGQVDVKKGVVLATGNFGSDFKNIKLVEVLAKKFGVSVKIDNDVKCFMRAEGKWGAARFYKNAIGLTIGTGIGGGLMINGELYRGVDNTAAEVGHMKISGQWIGPAPWCGCGEKYCWESVASGRAWHKIAKKCSEKKADEIIGHNLATGLFNLCLLYNPEIFVLGGGLMEHKKMLERLRKEFNLVTKNFPWFRKVKLVKARLGEEAILRGALM